ncbi:L-lactate dehydrogenase [cytochrome] [Luteitalea pratensis]|uniref:L-lactate dehydrogenase [cytochrome] n=1 Tax=Luteitalea pratensis TaxID=1855912 RepID=A0A143PIL1_LUTPR|nr:alpha-hydroxy acid oxidase [Luteitalea pratensis]AMY08397.1 L-lactate dehydrogenase [cytochrome] [Luteitalea pratensis]
MDIESGTNRREFLKFLAASPLLGALGQVPRSDDVIASTRDALNVFDFEPVARQKLPPAHYGYLATGVDDDATLRANRAGFSRYQMRSRRLIDVSRIDTSISLLGATWNTPIVLAPVSSQRAFHPEGELAVARAARSKRHLLMLSTLTTTPIEDVNAARGEPVWFQLYPTTEWNVTRSMVKRAESAGCPVLVFTVDQIIGTNRETLRRFERQDTRDCRVCHDRTSLKTRSTRRPMFDGLELAGVDWQPPVTWEYVKRLRDATSMRLVIKGIVTREDAELAVAHGADAIVCSNHGGRAEETGRSTIESLPEVLQGAAGRVPVLVDSGFRRGTDIFTALALGATAICVGRPYVWGLAAFGQEGVDTVLDILTRELQLAMRYAGTVAIPNITRGHVVERVGGHEASARD